MTRKNCKTRATNNESTLTIFVNIYSKQQLALESFPVEMLHLFCLLMTTKKPMSEFALGTENSTFKVQLLT